MRFANVTVVWSLMVVFSFLRAAVVLARAEQVLKSNVQPYISSILEALMEPVSQGFSEVREVLLRELVEIGKNTVNDGDGDALGKVGILHGRTAAVYLAFYNSTFAF